MATCIVLVDKCKEVDDYFEEVKYRMKWDMQRANKQCDRWSASEGKEYLLFNMSPIPIDFAMLGLIGSAVAVTLFGLNTWYYICLVVGLLAYFTTNQFLAMITEKALRKHKYTSTIIKITEQDKIVELLLARNKVKY